MKIRLRPESVARAQVYLVFCALLASFCFMTSYSNAVLIALMCCYVFIGAIAIIFKISRRKRPTHWIVGVSIWPLFLLFPIGTILGCAIYIALNRKDSKDYFAGTWRPTRQVLTKLRKDKAERSSEALSMLLFILGGAAGFFLTALACQWHSKEAMQVGWIFCFLTMPVAAFLGLGLGSLIGKWWRGGVPCTYCGYRITFRTKLCPSCQRPFKAQVIKNLNLVH